MRFIVFAELLEYLVVSTSEFGKSTFSPVLHTQAETMECTNVHTYHLPVVRGPTIEGADSDYSECFSEHNRNCDFVPLFHLIMSHLNNLVVAATCTTYFHVPYHRSTNEQRYRHLRRETGCRMHFAMHLLSCRRWTWYAVYVIN